MKRFLLHSAYNQLNPHEIEGTQEILSIPTCQDVAQLATRLVVCD